jgi:hypothetical protein
MIQNHCLPGRFLSEDSRRVRKERLKENNLQKKSNNKKKHVNGTENTPRRIFKV